MSAPSVESVVPAAGVSPAGEAPVRPRLIAGQPEQGAAPSQRRRIGALIAAGLAMQALLGACIVLYTNVPPGYNVPYGLSLDSPDVFRVLWPYPVISVEPGLFAPLAALAIVWLWAVYLGAWAIIGRCQGVTGRPRMAVVIVACCLLAHLLLVLFMPPVLSTDVYHYALFGRMVAIYGLNPYVVPGSAISGDPLWALADWHDVTTHYGPVWTLISGGAAALGGSSALLTVLIFKGVAALFNLANCLLVYRLARRLGGDGLGALLLYAWNPLILIETAGSGHNDAAMMTFALLGLLLAARGRLLWGLAALVLSVLVKYLTALLLLFYVLHCLGRQASRQQAVALAARMGAVATVIVVGLFVPFWAGPASLARLLEVGAPFKSFVRILLREWVAGLLAGGGDLAEARAAAEPYVVGGLHLGFGALMTLLAKAALSRPDGWRRAIELWGVASLVYVALVYGWNEPWFLVPTLATLCVVHQTRLGLRLLAISHGLGLLWMLVYPVLIAAAPS
jgi:hypothetical protein